jgi:hypothetical protein
MSGAMALCTGFILALQSASELRRFGALEFVVHLVAIAFTRELGPLITALSVSGRSASAISAEIGTMVVTEEVDVLRVMGLDPVELTLAPKYLAALITLPCLTILSTLCGIFAGFLFLAFSIDMSLRVYFQAVAESILLRDMALSLVKICNDLRWMNSGPHAGLAEISLPAIQPGSSIMPGKVNPVIPEAAAMVAAQVIGNDATVTIAGQSGNFQLNVMLPVVALNLIQSIELLASASRVLADSAIAGFKVNQARLDEALERNPILVTALNPVIGYEKGAAIAKQAYKEGRAIREVAEQETDLSAAKLKQLLDPLELTKGGIKGDGSGGGG